jgi:hypothetical protein
MKTFSQAPTETNELKDIVDILSILPDNTNKLISPKDVRDAVYTLWQNTMFKPTSFSGSIVDYIGIDSFQLKDDDNENWYPKMLFGKKQTGGQFIMSNNLLTSNTDFFFYNTKNNQVLTDYDTSIAILSGTGPFYADNMLKAPQLNSNFVSDINGGYMDFNIKNTSYTNDTSGFYGGNINIRSEKGFVSVNGFYFPTFKNIDDNINTYDGYILSLEKGIDGAAYGVWRSPFSQSFTNITVDEPFTINAPLITLNGYNFTDTTPTATAIGGIRAGETFNNINVQDMIRRIIYTYIPPRITSQLVLSPSNTPITLIESGDGTTRTNLRLKASVTKNATQSITSISYLANDIAVLKQMTRSTAVTDFPAPSSIPNGDTFAEFLVQGDIDLTSELYRTTAFTLSVADQYPTTRQVSSVIKVVLPYFYGTTTYSATNNVEMNSLLGNNNAPAGKLKTYLVEPIIGNPTNSNNQYLRFTTRGLPQTTGAGKGFIYFAHPEGFPQLKNIFDYNSFPVFNDFATQSFTVNHPDLLWNSKKYIFYYTKDITEVDLGTGTFSFIFT